MILPGFRDGQVLHSLYLRLWSKRFSLHLTVFESFLKHSKSKYLGDGQALLAIPRTWNDFGSFINNSYNDI